MKHGYVTVAAAIPRVKVADTEYNVGEILSMISDANDKGVEIIVFPELCVTGYTCQDLFRSDVLLRKAEEALISLLSATHKMDIIAIVGMPVAVDGLLLNSAVVVQGVSIIGIVSKTYLPNYS